MARLINLRSESDVYESLSTGIRNKLGSVYSGRDSTINAITEAVGTEIINLRRESEREFDSRQLSNASGEDLNSLAFELYRLERTPQAFAKVLAREKNLYFYVDVGTFGEINSGAAINLTKGTLISTERAFTSADLVYQITEDYTLQAGSSFGYCSARALNPGAYANVSQEAIQHHDFADYTDIANNTLRVLNKFPIINGRDIESDASLRYRTANYFTGITNKNHDAINLTSIGVPGIKEVRLIPGYLGIGTLAVVAFGQGRELTKNVAALLEDRIAELSSPGQSIKVVSGITVYFDFKLKVYIKPKLSEIEKALIKTDIKRDIANLIKSHEFSNYLDFQAISNIVLRNMSGNNILGFATNSTNNNSIFEEVFIRKTDQFDEFPSEKESLASPNYSIGRDERISFGEIIVNLEEDIR